MKLYSRIIQGVVRPIRTIVVRAVRKYGKDDPIRLAGTTAYFVVFAIAPILIIIIGALGLLVDEQTVSTKLYDEIEVLIGPSSRGFLKGLVENFRENDRNVAGTSIGVVVFIFASTTFFGVLQKNLNFIWRVRAKPRHGILKMLKDRLLSFGLILSLGFVLLVSLVIDTALTFLDDFLTRYVAEMTIVLVQPVNMAISLAIITLIFAMIFKVLPDAHISWRVTWVGAAITAVLFTIGKFVIGFVLGAASFDIMYGAAGSIVILLVWVFYSSLILYFGAEITQEYARYYGHHIRPKDHAVALAIREIEEEESQETPTP